MAKPSYQSEAWRTIGCIVGLLAAIPLIGTGQLGEIARELLESARSDRMNQADADMQILSYYDSVQGRRTGDATNLASASDLRTGRSAQTGDADDRIEESDAVRHIEGYLRYELKPNVEVMYRDVPLVTNRWGQRDRDYDRAKPAGTLRSALVGASFVMGSGVRYEDSFAYLLEERLNENGPLAQKGRPVEIINFGVNGYFLPEFANVIEEKVPPFDPDMVLLGLVRADRRLLPTRVAKRLYLRSSIDDLRYENLAKVIAGAGLQQADFGDMGRLTRKLQPLRDQLVVAALRDIASLARHMGIPVVIFVLHLEAGQPADDDTRWIADRAEQLGFPVLRIFQAYETADPSGMYLSSWDRHPTPMAHRLLTDNIIQEMCRHRQVQQLLSADHDSDH